MDGVGVGRRHKLDADRIVLGRHPDCDIVLELGAVSRRHALVDRTEGAFFVEDLQSRNGTYVNGSLATGRRRLRHGDELRICETLFRFVGDEQRDDEALGVGALLNAEDDDSSTILSKIDLTATGSGLRLSVKPEVKLKALVEISRSLGRALSLDEVLPSVLDSLFKVFLQADRGFIALWDRGSDALRVRAVKRRRESDQSVRFSNTIVNQVRASKEAVLSADAATDSRFEMSQSIADFRIRSMMCVPMLSSEEDVLGVLQIDTSDQRARFQPEDLEVLVSVAGLAGVAIENATLHEMALGQKAIERDLELAHEVQQGLLPSSAPNAAQFDFFDFYEPANQVGGDYYDYVALPGGRCAAVLADVSGKGVAAALVMAKLSGEVRYSLASDSDLGRAVSRINNLCCRDAWEGRFVTFVLMLLDEESGRLSIVNAGHMPPIIRKLGGEVVELGESVAGVPLGVVPDAGYQVFETDLQPGELVLVYTDGISEAMNRGGDLYSIERVVDTLGRSKGSAGETGRFVLEDVKRFVDGRSQSDDMCMLCIGRK